MLDGAQGFLIDMRGDTHALDGRAADALRRAFAGDTLSGGDQAFVLGLISDGVLETETQRRGDVRPSRRAALLASLTRGALVLNQTGHAVRLARLSFAAVGWAETLQAWRHGIRSSVHGRTLAEIGAAVARATANDPTGADCKERALTAFTLARRNCHPAFIIVGAALHPLAVHAWCESGDQVIGDSAGRIAAYTPLLRYA
ncbi:lasso peptide biosynthesis B2 protein [Aestuariivirga sp.]|uniref:lasso peptide biosynthesis B2 protein n=1 Tax=Aestuariivirga sp. TaxID=2650926 RepID=UPI0039E62D09